MNEENVKTKDPEKSVKVYSVNKNILNSNFKNTFANESTKVNNVLYPISVNLQLQTETEDTYPVDYSKVLSKEELQSILDGIQPGPDSFTQEVLTAGKEKGFVGKLMDKLIAKSNENYWHPIYGAPARWKASMRNDTNPLIGIKKTAVPAANGAFLATGLGAIPGLAKTVFKLPIRTFWNFVPDLTIETVGAKAGNWIDENILQGDGTLGTTVGGLAGMRLVLNLFERARRSMYRNITPFGYGYVPSGRTRGKEIKNFLKETFSTKPLPTENPDGTPVLNWYPALDKNMELMDLDADALVRFRDQAMRKALKLRPLYYEPSVYRLNDDGITYSYDIDNINKMRPQLIENLSKSDLYIGKNRYYDFFTTNGGLVGIINENGADYMIDRWDLQPFNDYRTISNFVTKKVPFMKNFEIIDFLRGNPFTVKHRLKK